MNIFKINFSQERVFGLDILRALAIFFVVYAHGLELFSDYMMVRVLELPVLDGVSIFFVLSGFLIGGILIKIIETQKLTSFALIEFWKRRWFRTLPNYFLILITTFLIYKYGSTKSIDFDLYEYFFFLQNVNSPHPNFFPEAWSLSIEEWFYLFIPSALFLTIKCGFKPQKGILLLIILVIIASIYVRYYKYYSYEIETLANWDIVFRKQVSTRLDSIMFGVVGAYINYYYRHYWLEYKKTLLVAGILLLLIHKLTFLLKGVLGLEFNLYYCVYSFSVSSIATLLLLPFLSDYKGGAGKMYKLVTIFSLTSYSMYLLNYSIVKGFLVPWSLSMLPMPFSGLALELFTYFIFWVFTFYGAILLYKYFEVPSIKLRDISFFVRKNKVEREM